MLLGPCGRVACENDKLYYFKCELVLEATGFVGLGFEINTDWHDDNKHWWNECFQQKQMVFGTEWSKIVGLTWLRIPWWYRMIIISRKRDLALIVIAIGRLLNYVVFIPIDDKSRNDNWEEDQIAFHFSKQKAFY